MYNHVTDIFETQTCTRCGGTGKFSWCQTHRDVCFKCRGVGRIMTKRGLAAYTYWKQIREVEFKDLRIGMCVRAGNYGHFFTVETIQPDPLNVCHYQVDGRTKSGTSEGVCCFDNHVFTLRSNREYINVSLEYQAKLTKAGKLMKKYQ